MAKYIVITTYEPYRVEISNINAKDVEDIFNILQRDAKCDKVHGVVHHRIVEVVATVSI